VKAVRPTAPPTVFAATYGEGVFTSSDLGQTWRPMNTDLGNLVVAALAADSQGTFVHAATYGAGVFDLTLGPPPPSTVKLRPEGVSETPKIPPCCTLKFPPLLQEEGMTESTLQGEMAGQRTAPPDSRGQEGWEKSSQVRPSELTTGCEEGPGERREGPSGGRSPSFAGLCGCAKLPARRAAAVAALPCTGPRQIFSRFTNMMVRPIERGAIAGHS